MDSILSEKGREENLEIREYKMGDAQKTFQFGHPSVRPSVTSSGVGVADLKENKLDLVDGNIFDPIKSI